MRKDAKLFQPGADGYQYIGKYYSFPLGGEALRRRKLAWLFLSALALAAFLAAGFLDVNATRAAYVAIPYALSLAPLGYALAGAFSMLGMGGQMTVPQWKRGPRRLLRASAGAAAALVLALCGAAVRGAVSGAAEPLFPALCALAAAFSGLNLRLCATCRAREGEQPANAR